MRNYVASLLAVALAALAFASTASAQNYKSLRVRGEVVNLDGPIVSVENSAGQVVEVSMPEPVVLTFSDIALSNIDLGGYVSVPSLAMADGARRGLGLTLWPEEMRGINEGYIDWDLSAENKMTNATLKQVTSRGGEKLITLSYGEQKEEQTLVLPPYAPVTVFVQSKEKKLETGMNVVLFAREKDGKISAKFAGLREDNELPPL